jgi:DNA-binding Lrp family transcriptional regulator
VGIVGAVSVRAYILIETEMGKAGEVARAIRGLPGIAAADDVTGPYDIIVRAEAADLDALGRTVLSQIQTIGGITRTVTCPVVNL